MVTHRWRKWVGGVVLALVVGGVTGCAPKTEMSKKEQDNFKGGPMPPGFLEKQGNGPAAPKGK